MFTTKKELVRDFVFMKVLLRSFDAHWDLKASWQKEPGPFNTK